MRPGEGRRDCSMPWACCPSTATAIPHEFSGGQRQRIGIARALVLRALGHRPGRAGVGVGRVGPGPGDQPARRHPERVRSGLHVHRPRSVRGPPHLRSGDGDVSRPDGRDRHVGVALRVASPPIQPFVAVGGCRSPIRPSRSRGSGSSSKATSRARRTRRPDAASVRVARSPSSAARPRNRSCARSGRGTSCPATSRSSRVRRCSTASGRCRSPPDQESSSWPTRARSCCIRRGAVG